MFAVPCPYYSFRTQTKVSHFVTFDQVPLRPTEIRCKSETLFSMKPGDGMHSEDELVLFMEVKGLRNRIPPVREGIPLQGRPVPEQRSVRSPVLL